MKYEKIGVIGAMNIETEGLIASMENPVTERVSGALFTTGRIAGREVTVATSGIGKVFAAMAAEVLILRYGVEALLNTGVAGGLLPEMRPFDAVVAADVVQHDMNTTAIGDPQGLLSGINRIELPTDKALSDKLAEAAASLGLRVTRGRVASGDLFVAKEKTKNNIRTRFGAAACEMEGGAIGQVAFVNQIPFAVLRLISDGGDGMEYEKFAPLAADYSIKTTLAFLKNL